MDIIYEESAGSQNAKKGEKWYKVVNVIYKISLVLGILCLVFLLMNLPFGKPGASASEEQLQAYAMVVLPGGPGHGKLEECKELMEMVDAYFVAGKYVAAICAAPSILGKRGILRGKKACCFPSFETFLEGAEVSFDKVCVDGNVITSRGMGTAMDFAIAIVEVLEGKQKAQEKAKEIVYV